MEYIVLTVLGVAFVGLYAAILPYKRDFEATVAKLEKQNAARLRFY